MRWLRKASAQPGLAPSNSGSAPVVSPRLPHLRRLRRYSGTSAPDSRSRLAMANHCCIPIRLPGKEMSNPYASLPARTGAGLVNVIIDTPKGSRNKFKFDEQAECFRLSRILPVGASFPYDFGSIPGTLAEDGDPLDVLVIAEEASFAGCLLSARLIGAVRAPSRRKKAGRSATTASWPCLSPV